ncbi:uncharacterized protein PAF06_016082 [Gastrophryne carolinensis]
MDPFSGIEVGAEVELNDGSAAVEDSIKLENKQDLPLWQNLHYFDDSSSDESLDQPYEIPTPEKFKNQEMMNPVLDLKSSVKAQDHLKKNVSAYTTPGDAQSVFLYVNEVPRDDHIVVWNNTFNKGLQEQPSQLAPHFEETGISCVEVIPSIDFGHLPPSFSKEVCAKTLYSYEELSAEALGRYSYFNAETQFTGSVKPWGKSHKCQQCGRKFGRLYNLENHKCIKMCLGSPQQNIINNETMNRLEKMCAEAQKELQKLQGHCKIEHEGAVTGVLGEIGTQVWNQDLLSDTVKCNSCGLQFRGGVGLDDHVCGEYASQNLTIPENTVVLHLTHSELAGETQSITPVKEERTDLNPIVFYENNNLVEATKVPKESSTFYKCLECGKMFDKRCSITNHLRWHAREKFLISSVGNAFVEPSPVVQEPDRDFSASPIGQGYVSPTKPSQTFACEYCGRIFDKLCSYAAHTCWHMKNKESVATTEIQEANDQADQVPLILIKGQEDNDRECASPMEICTCQSCGAVFSKICHFISHTCKATEEQYRQQRMMEAQVFLVAEEEYSEEGHTKDVVDQNHTASDVDPIKEEHGSSLDDGNFQGYCNLVGQLRLDEKVKVEEPGELSPPVEANQQPPEVLESIFELIVGTEEVREILLGKEGHIVTNEEDSGKALEMFQVKPKVEPVEKRPFIFPSAFVSQLLNRVRSPHRCRDCGTRFRQAWQLKRHCSKVTRNALKKHRCECGRTPIGSLHFLLHQLQHLRDTPFNCATCGKRLRGYRQLRAHGWVHRLVSHFQCKCGARFTQLPRYLWHSLLNNAKARPKAQLRPPAGLQAP